jgi:nucleoside-diphosphate-sugar epimerase
MKILVLGSEGQIGSPFCDLARQKGHNIVRIDKKIHSHHDLSTKEGELIFDLLIKDCDVVVFLAFEVGGSKYLEATDKTIAYISENVRLMDNCFRVLMKHKKPFLFASSQMANMHHTNYGFLKDLGERYTRVTDGWICRFWNVFGYEDPTDVKSHVITDFIHMAKTTGKIVMRTTGKEKRQFLHSLDCSKALLHWVENYSSYDKKEYIDITSFEWKSILDVAREIQKLIPCEIIEGVKSDSIQAGILNEPSNYVLKFWKPELKLEEGIKFLI